MYILKTTKLIIIITADVHELPRQEANTVAFVQSWDSPDVGQSHT